MRKHFLFSLMIFLLVKSNLVHAMDRYRDEDYTRPRAAASHDSRTHRHTPREDIDPAAQVLEHQLVEALTHITNFLNPTDPHESAKRTEAARTCWINALHRVAPTLDPRTTENFRQFAESIGDERHIQEIMAEPRVTPTLPESPRHSPPPVYPPREYFAQRLTDEAANLLTEINLDAYPETDHAFIFSTRIKTIDQLIERFRQQSTPHPRYQESIDQWIDTLMQQRVEVQRMLTRMDEQAAGQLAIQERQSQPGHHRSGGYGERSYRGRDYPYRR